MILIYIIPKLWNVLEQLDEWLSCNGEFLLCQYDEYVKMKIRNNEINDIKLLEDWLIENDIELFNEYDRYVESVLKSIKV